MAGDNGGRVRGNVAVPDTEATRDTGGARIGNDGGMRNMEKIPRERGSKERNQGNAPMSKKNMENDRVCLDMDPA